MIYIMHRPNVLYRFEQKNIDKKSSLFLRNVLVLYAKEKKEEKHLICIAINCVSRNHTKFCNYANIQLISYKWFLECTLIQWRLYGYIYPQCTQVAEGTFFNKKQLGLKKSIFGPKCLGLFLVTHNPVYYCKMRTLASRMPSHPSRNSEPTSSDDLITT